MADELVEPQETKVPDQAEMFRQEVDPQPEPVPVVEPEPEPAPVAEPEPPPVEPDWLNAPVEPESQYPPQQYYEPPPQYYPQQPQAPSQPAGVDAALQTFVDNPDGWLNQKMQTERQQLVGPLAQQQHQIAQLTSMLVNDRITEGTSGADESIRNAYKVFNQDPTFRSNKGMQESLKATFQGMRRRAEYEARTTGNFDPLRTLANLKEADMRATLAYMKEKAGVRSPGVGPLQVEGATVESSRSAVAEQKVELTADEEAAVRRLGPGGRARLIQAKIDQAKYDDFESRE